VDCGARPNFAPESRPQSEAAQSGRVEEEDAA
jgi:hypothetical protein